MAHDSKTVWIIGTPIGNLEDLTARARQVIESLDILACEDTRRAGRLCQLAGISRPPKFVILNEHTEEKATTKLLAEIKAGKRVGLISDAGMPTICDPGKDFVAALYEAGVEVSVVPGPTAISTALALSGMDANRFVFEGFLPRKGRRRTERMAYLESEKRTVVIYESPYRLNATLQDLFSALGHLGNRRVFVAKELTKLHEETWRGDLADLADLANSSDLKKPFSAFGDAPKGEFVIVLEGASGAV